MLQYPEFYRTVVGKSSIFEEETTRIGIHVSSSNKPDLINTTAEFLHNGWLILKDKQTIKELSQFRATKTASGNVTLSAPKGAHDDCVLALVHAVYGGRDNVPTFYEVSSIGGF